MIVNSNNVLLYKISDHFRDVKLNVFGNLTGFSPSAGAVVISSAKSAIFVDSRYQLAAKQNVDLDKFEIHNLSNSEIISWIKNNIAKDMLIVYDPSFFSVSVINSLKTQLDGYQFCEKDFSKLLQISRDPNQSYYVAVPGIGMDAKIQFIRDSIAKNNLDAYLLCDPNTVSWLTNCRDLSDEYTLSLNAYLLITTHNDAVLYVDDSCCSNLPIQTRDFKFLPNDLMKYNRVGIDFASTPGIFQLENCVDIANPCSHVKSVKSDVEVIHMRKAALDDSAAFINFMYWFYHYNGTISEMQVVEHLRCCRQRNPEFLTESFQTIAAADEHAAMIHYAPSSSSDKVVQSILLLDAGGQYKYGTTDITRTISKGEISADRRRLYTLVLKGHIALASAMFPIGTTGSKLDPLARQFLWKDCLDYQHSTGHGIGFLSHVHEGPAGIGAYNKTALEPGMILSNEPGVYIEGDCGIRLENMMLVMDAQQSDFLRFDMLSFVPFDPNFMIVDELDKHELKWLRSYNEKILSSVDLPVAVQNWLYNFIKLG